MENNFTNNESESQFELNINGEIAFIEYFIEDNKIHLTHTEVPKALQANGVGTELVKHSLQYIKEHNLTLVPTCSFVADYVNNNPKWHSILSEGYQM